MNTDALRKVSAVIRARPRSIKIFLFACGIALALLVALTGSTRAIDLANVQDNAEMAAGTLDAKTTIGQTFRPHHSRLQTIEVAWIVSDDFAANGSVVLHVRHARTDSVDLATSVLSIQQIRHNGFTQFAFAPIVASQGESFYFFIDVAQVAIERGTLSLWASAVDAYPDGQLFVGDYPARVDLVFRAYYDPDLGDLLAALLTTLALHLRTIIFALIIFAIPGLLFVSAFDPFDAVLSFRVALCIGAGIAVLAAGSIVALWLRVSPQAMYVAICAILLGACVLRAHTFNLNEWRARWSIPRIDWTDGALGILTVLAFGEAFLQIRDLQTPLWVDSITHADYISQIITQAQLPLARFYHLGYHVVTTLVIQFANVSIPQAMLVVGQLLWVQVGLSVYLFCRRLSGNSFAALTSAVVVWFLMPTPAYFITWGRYPLLMGSALLPLALLSVIELFERPVLEWRTLVFATVMLAGLVFTQIRLVVFFLAFALVYLMGQLHASQNNARPLWRMVPLVVMVSALGILWLGSLFAHGTTWESFFALNNAAPLIDLDTAFAVVQAHHGLVAVALAALGMVFGLVQRSRVATIVLAWYIPLALISVMPQTEGRPYLEPSLIVLMAFLPASLLVGDLAIALGCVFGKVSSKARVIGVIYLLALSMLGARDMTTIVNPATILFFDADQRAMEWIRRNTPSDAKFLIDSHVWVDSAYMPTDGGSWIPYLTGRAVDYLWGNEVVQRTPAEFSRWLDEHQVQFIYLGKRAGILPRAYFDCQAERYAPVYHLDGVQIFEMQNYSAPLHSCND